MSPKSAPIDEATISVIFYIPPYSFSISDSKNISYMR